MTKNSAHAPADSGSTSRLRGLILAGLVILGLFLYLWFGRSAVIVEGKVRSKGQLLTTGEIQFVAPDGRSRSSPIGSDGSYRILDCPRGQVKVAVIVQVVKEVPGAVKIDPTMVDPTKLPPPPIMISLVAAKYNSIDTSGLTFTIGRGRQKIDIDLKD